MRLDTTTLDTRLADDPLQFNPATATSLVRLMLGGLPAGSFATPLYARFRYFDPVNRRAGIPADVAALVTRLGGNRSDLVLVNISQTEPREVIVQGGAYGEHDLKQVTWNDQRVPVTGKCFRVKLQPGCGATLTVEHQCYANAPTLKHPWDE